MKNQKSMRTARAKSKSARHKQIQTRLDPGSCLHPRLGWRARGRLLIALPMLIKQGFSPAHVRHLPATAAACSLCTIVAFDNNIIIILLFSSGYYNTTS